MQIFRNLIGTMWVLSLLLLLGALTWSAHIMVVMYILQQLVLPTLITMYSLISVFTFKTVLKYIDSELDKAE